MEATCLIEFTSSGTLNINQTALCFLKTVQQPLQVVSIFGPKGTGKSFLMNKIAGIPRGFPLSLPGCPHVEGMWMLCLPHPSLNGHHLLLLDVEGFDPEQGDKRKETTLFILAVLLSNVFIYNTQGEATGEELQKLIHIKELPHLVNATSNEDPYIAFLSDHLPDFVWCVRDAALELEVEETMALENCIEDILMTDNGADDSPVGLINKLFSHINLFEICEPFPGFRNLNPELVPDTQLRFIFKKQIQKLQQFIFDRRPTTMNDRRNSNGQILASLMVSFTNKLSSGDIVILKEVFEQGIIEEERKHLDYPDRNFQINTFKNEDERTCTLLPSDQDGTGLSNWETGYQRKEEFNCMESSHHSSKVRGSLTNISSAPFSMENPICLIDSDSSGELHVNQEALKILLEVQHPVVVVAIVGLYRTGKSYLMNKLAGKQKGFSMGSTVESHTKGIWMWCVPHPLKHDHTLILLDTEGLGDVEKGDDKHDCWIFALAVLLSSMFVYNSLGTIDQNALDKLHYVTELTEHIKVKSSLNNESDSCLFARFFPAFIWTVRDFSLKLKWKKQLITEDEYLEHALKLRPGSSKKVQDYNSTRECIRNYFPSRKCFVFERPTSKTEELQNLEELTEDCLEPVFVKQVQTFCQHVFETSKAKTLQGGHTVTGRLLGNLAVTYVDTIRTGTIPCLENAVLLLSQTENSVAVKQAVEHYEMKMKCMILPTDTIGNFLELHAVCEKEAIQIFMNRSFKDDERKHQQQLMNMIKQSFERFHQKNEKESTDRCTTVIVHVSQELEDQMTEGYYFKPGGYSCFRKDLMDIVEAYKAFPGKGIKADEVLKAFMQEKEVIARAVLQTDVTCTEKEKQIEDERLKREAAELQRIAMEKKSADVQQMVLNQQKSYEENVRQLKIKLEEDRRSLLEELERVIDQKLKEQALLKDEFHEKAEKLEAQILSLQKEKKAAKSTSFLSIAINALGIIASLVLPGPEGKIIGVGAKILSQIV
ncbi:guanylate-binding protein 1-like isoform X1 [Protopterus annectens]|uniref:guanylate-binding protein 1-like isoform X1 n=1 Tax=Protopterus annectens TaxID=7888 RepID=UPI001CFAE760|nr:guanylate-binding protein 1-like isoform X1 [Protopterus annectens]